jgi:predicted RNase H-like HicB family nuclease
MSLNGASRLYPSNEMTLGFSPSPLTTWLGQPHYPFMLLSAVLIPAEEGGFVALNPETGATSQGESVPEALVNLREATELYLEEFPYASAGQPLLTTFEVAAPVHA